MDGAVHACVLEIEVRLKVDVSILQRDTPRNYLPGEACRFHGNQVSLSSLSLLGQDRFMFSPICSPPFAPLEKRPLETRCVFIAVTLKPVFF